MSWGAGQPAPHGGLPSLRLLRREALARAADPAAAPPARLHLRLQLPAAGWFGALNVSWARGGVTDWSWTPHFRAAGAGAQLIASGGSGWRVVRFAGQGAASARWDFWVDVTAGAALRVDVAAAAGGAGDARMPELPLPDWVSASRLVTCLSTWRF